jgi:hypothetical protein
VLTAAVEPAEKRKWKVMGMSVATTWMMVLAERGGLEEDDLNKRGGLLMNNRLMTDVHLYSSGWG